jgi:hypothetical protein
MEQGAMNSSRDETDTIRRFFPHTYWVFCLSLRVMN